MTKPINDSTPIPNYFKVNRLLLNSDRWLNESFTRGQAWVDLFGLAQHKKGYIRLRGVRIPLKRGQVGYSQLTLASRWKWSRGKVKRYLNELEKDGDIIQQTVQQNERLTTLITVVKYNQWQGSDTTSRTTDGQQTDNKQYSNNKDNKEKNDNKGEDIVIIEHFIKQYEERYKHKPTINWGRERKLISFFLKEINKNELISIIDEYLKDNDNYITTRAHPFPLMRTRFDEYRLKIKKYNNKLIYK